MFIALLAATGRAHAGTVLPYQGTGYKYLQVPSGQEPSGWQNATFDDSGWATGDAAFGSGGNCALQSTVKTHWDLNTDILLRKAIALPPGSHVSLVGVTIDNDVKVYWNGVLIGSSTHEFCPAYNDFSFSVPDNLVSATNVLAVEGIDRGGESFLDLTVAGDAGAAQPLTITTLQFNRGTVGAAYTQDIAATGGTPPYTWSVASGRLPTDLRIENGFEPRVSGTPSAGGTSSFTLEVKDSAGQTAHAPFSIAVGWRLQVFTTGAGPMDCCVTNQQTSPVITSPHVAVVLVGDWWCNLLRGGHPVGPTCQKPSRDVRADITEAGEFVATIGGLIQRDYGPSSEYEAPLANYYQVDCSLLGGCTRTPVGHGVTQDHYAPYGGTIWAGPIRPEDVQSALPSIQAGFGIVPSDLKHTVFVLLYAPDLLPGASTTTPPSTSLSCPDGNPSANALDTRLGRYNVAHIYLENALWNCLDDVRFGLGSQIDYQQFATYVASHELNEDITDPLGKWPQGAWLVATVWQVADVCEFRNEAGETRPVPDADFKFRNYTRDSFGTVVASYVTPTNPSSCTP